MSTDDGLTRSACSLPANPSRLGTASSKRLRSIDFLRGIAALAVVVHHSAMYGIQPTQRWFRPFAIIAAQGYLGVPLFFVISGFCIHLGWARQKVRGPQASVSWYGFWQRRIFRLYPPYLGVLVLSMALVTVGYVFGIDTSIISQYPNPKGRWIALDFLSHAVMAHGLLPKFDKMGGNPPFWTLAREEYLYVLYAPLLLFRRKVGLKFSIAAVALAGVVFPILFIPFVPARSIWWQTIHSSAIALWVEWAIGMVAVEAYYGLINLPDILYRPWMSVFWGMSAKYCEIRELPSVAAIFWALCFVTLVNYCVRREKTGQWFTGRVAAWFTGVGVFSYSLYLVHYPTEAVAKRMLGGLATTRNPLLYLLNAILLSVAAYWASQLFFHLVERRFLNSRWPQRGTGSSPSRQIEPRDASVS